MTATILNELHAIMPSVFPEVIEFRGGMWDELLSRLESDDWEGMHHEYLIVGGAGTAKTTGDAFFVHGVARRFPGAKILVLRQNRVDLTDSFMETFEEEVLDFENELDAYVLMNGGRKRPVRANRQHYLYPTDRRTGRQSMIRVGGMDKWERYRSTRWDIILIIEATEVAKDNIEGIARSQRPQRSRWRSLERSSLPFRCLIMETNPDGPEHHLKKRADRKTCHLIETTIKDNPGFWDRVANDFTPDGRQYVDRMTNSMSGHVYKRLVLGQWAGAVGGIFEMWSRPTHVVNGTVIEGAGDIPDRIVFAEPHRQLGPSVEVAWYLGGYDRGLRNAGSLGVWAFDTAGRMWLVHEVYEPERGIEWWGEQVAAAFAKYPMRALACDHDWYFINRFNEMIHKANEQMFGRYDPGVYTLPEGLSEDVLEAMLQRDAVVASREKGGRVRIAQNATKSHGRATDLTNLELLRRAMMPGLDGVPRFLVLSNARQGTRPPTLDADKPWGVVEEIERAVWAKRRVSADSALPREEIDLACDDHGIDEAAYAVAYAFGREQRDVRAPKTLRAPKIGTWEYEEQRNPGRSMFGPAPQEDASDWRDN